MTYITETLNLNAEALKFMEIELREGVSDDRPGILSAGDILVYTDAAGQINADRVTLEDLSTYDKIVGLLSKGCGCQVKLFSYSETASYLGVAKRGDEKTLAMLVDLRRGTYIPFQLSPGLDAGKFRTTLSCPTISGNYISKNCYDAERSFFFSLDVYQDAREELKLFHDEIQDRWLSQDLSQSLIAKFVSQALKLSEIEATALQRKVQYDEARGEGG